jgi:hypothetical protein
MSFGRGWYQASLLTTAMGRHLYMTICRDTSVTHAEGYLRGPSLVAALTAWGYFYPQNDDEEVLLRSLSEMQEIGVLEARGPEAWAIKFADEFVWPIGSPPTRQELFERDGWHCQYCGQRICMDSGHADHVFPKSRGGWDDAANLVASCWRCNLSKGSRTHIEWDADQYAEHERKKNSRKRGL